MVNPTVTNVLTKVAEYSLVYSAKVERLAAIATKASFLAYYSIGSVGVAFSLLHCERYAFTFIRHQFRTLFSGRFSPLNPLSSELNRAFFNSPVLKATSYVLAPIAIIQYLAVSILLVSTSVKYASAHYLKKDVDWTNWKNMTADIKTFSW